MKSTVLIVLGAKRGFSTSRNRKMTGDQRSEVCFHLFGFPYCGSVDATIKVYANQLSIVQPRTNKMCSAR